MVCTTNARTSTHHLSKFLAVIHVVYFSCCASVAILLVHQVVVFFEDSWRLSDRNPSIPVSVGKSERFLPERKVPVFAVLQERSVHLDSVMIDLVMQRLR